MRFAPFGFLDQKIIPIGFSVSGVCSNGTSTITVYNITGGTGQYQIDQVLYTTASGATNGTFIDVVGSSVNYFTVADGTWYVAVRDKNYTSNITVNQFVADCIIPGNCTCWSVYNPDAGSHVVEYYACDGSQIGEGVPGGSTSYICVISGTTPVDYDGVGLVITQCSPVVSCTGSTQCINCGATPTPTPTNTNTPTPTPTATPTNTPTPTPLPQYKVELCGGGEGPYIVSLISGDSPSGIGQSYKLFKTGTPFDGIKCWEILENPAVGTPDYTEVAFGTVYSNCLACLPTPTPTPTNTPTPTPTNTNTPTPTPTFPPCVTSVTFDVDSAGDVRYVDCCGNTIYITYGIGPQVINDCIQYGSVFAVGATISFITYNNTACVCPPTPTPTNTNTPTPTPTNTNTPTPTNTPTATPVPPAYNYYTFTPCTGGAGTDYRSILSLALGDVYTFQAYPPTRACYEITSINASVNTNDLPTIYGPLSGCGDSFCQQP